MKRRSSRATGGNYLDVHRLALGIDGDAQGDRFNSIENVVGTNFADRAFGFDGGTKAELKGGDDTFDNSRSKNVRDDVSGGAGNDIIITGGGDDFLKGDAGTDDLRGEDGNDRLQGGQGADKISGGSGTDSADYSTSSSRVILFLSPTDDFGINTIPGTGDQPAGVKEGDAEGDVIAGLAEGRTDIEGIIGSTFDDLVYGFDKGTIADLGGGNDIFENKKDANFRDIVFGGGGEDLIFTGGGNDDIEGGLGKDRVHGEGGNDLFVYKTKETTVDEIVDFTRGQDKIDLRVLDANDILAGGQDFRFIGGAGANEVPRPFDGAGQVRSYVSGSLTFVEANTDSNNATVELKIALERLVTPMTTNDFLL